jgi:D-serine deaminase-like pyridoxal phosphate-dependent protein
MKRRTVILSSLGAGALGALALRPASHGAPHDAYFAALSKAAAQAGITTPTLIIDKQKLLANAQTVARNINGKIALRLVAKSLPCIPLLDSMMHMLATRRLMVFNLPQLLQLANERPDTDLLLGKPLPVAACARFYQQLQANGFRPQQQMQWLIDGRERLLQYRDLARAQNLTLRINLEIDVGLHRGGVPDTASLKELLDIIKAEPRLQWSGLMGYDAHVNKLPDLPGKRADAHAHAQAIYRDMYAMALAQLGVPASALTLNAGGSPTYRLHDGSGSANEVALGSALLKASDFDTEMLRDLSAAVFIATPVLKAQSEFNMPYGVELLGNLARLWDANARRAYFIYGGNWLADPVSPGGLSYSGLYGTSSNQQVVLGSGAQNLKIDDFIFFRPRQSEAVLLQFGAIALYEQGRISDYWQPMPPSA